ncbi:MAG: hypothetical protein V4698_03495 [Bacteroidota bacterium]
MLESFRENGIKGHCSRIGFEWLKAELKTRGINIDEDVFFSRPKKNSSSDEGKA